MSSVYRGFEPWPLRFKKKKRKLGVTSVKVRLHSAPRGGVAQVTCPGPALCFCSTLSDRRSKPDSLLSPLTLE